MITGGSWFSAYERQQDTAAIYNKKDTQQESGAGIGPSCFSIDAQDRVRNSSG